MQLETLGMLQEAVVDGEDGTSGLGSRTAPGRDRIATFDQSRTRPTVAGSRRAEPPRIGERRDFGEWAAALTDAVRERRELSRTAPLE